MRSSRKGSRKEIEHSGRKTPSWRSKHSASGSRTVEDRIRLVAQTLGIDRHSRKRLEFFAQMGVQGDGNICIGKTIKRQKRELKRPKQGFTTKMGQGCTRK